MPFLVSLVLTVPVTLQSRATGITPIVPSHADTTLSKDLSEIVVSARAPQVSHNAVSQQLDQKDLQLELGNSFAATVEQVKGMSMIKSGTTIAKPVIQGMHSNRILIMNNGVRQQGQQWGDDHAPELDINSASMVNIVKGAESVRYGSEALGGVILLESRTLPYDSDKLHGHLTTLLGSNGWRYAFTGLLEGSLPFNRNWAWRVQGTCVNSGDQSTAKYILNNTGMRETDFSATLGYRNEKLTAELFYSRYYTNIGVLYTAHFGDVDLQKQRIAIGQPVEIFPFTRHIDYPHQQVIHQIARARLSYDIHPKSTLRFQYAFQRDNRNEFHLRRNFRSNIPSLSLTLLAFQTDAEWKYRLSRHLHFDLGTTFSHLDNSNRAGTGIVPVIPNYTLSSTGSYLMIKYFHEKWGAEGGLRFDFEKSNASGINLYSHHYGSRRQFTNFTYNLGGHYRLNEHASVVSNVGVAWRAPHVHELYSNGLDHATGIYAVGDSTMQSERSLKWITSINVQLSPFTFSVDAYLQWVNNFIYCEPSQQYMTVVSGTYPMFLYKQTKAFFRGIDAEAKWSICNWLDYNVNASMIWVNERHTGRYLPYIPSFRTTQSLDFKLQSLWGLKTPYLKIKHKYVAKQNRFDPATDLIPYSPPAYHLFALEVGTDVKLGKMGKLNLSFFAENLLNRQYKEYTDRFRYYSHAIGRDLRIVATWTF